MLPEANRDQSFPAADVCLDLADRDQIIRILDEDEKGVRIVDTPFGRQDLSGARNQAEMTAVGSVRRHTQNSLQSSSGRE